MSAYRSSEFVYDEKYLKTKTKSYKGKINGNFHKNKTLKEGSQCNFDRFCF